MKTSHQQKIKIAAGWLCAIAILLYGIKVQYEEQQKIKILLARQIVVEEQLKNLLKEQATIQQEVLDRCLTMEELTVELESSVIDRWKRKDAEIAWKQVFESNPNISVPKNFRPFSPINPYENLK